MITFIFGRHANTHKPADKNADDLARTLTEKGLEQARALGDKLAGRTPDIVFSSFATRAVQTAKAVLGEDVAVTELQELYLPTNQADREASDAQFARLGYASLRTYMQEDAGIYERYGQVAKEAILRHLKGTEKTVAVFGHAVMLNAIALAFKQDDGVLDLVLSECGTIEIEV